MLKLTPEIRAKLAEKMRERLLAKIGPEKFAKLQTAFKARLNQIGGK